LKIPAEHRYSRRSFAAAAGAMAGTACLEAAWEETRSAGALSPETARGVLAYLGYPPKSNDELRRLLPTLEQTFRAILAIRDFEVPLFLEPAFVVRAGAEETYGRR